MPERGEIFYFAECIRKLFIGRKMVDLDFNEKSKYYKKSLTHHEFLRSYLKDNSIYLYDVRSQGKKIIFVLSKVLPNLKDISLDLTIKRPNSKLINEDPDDSIYLISSLGMEGRWILQRKKHSNLWIDFDGFNFPRYQLSKVSPVLLEEYGMDPNGQENFYPITCLTRLYYDDTRKFGALEIFKDKKAMMKRLTSTVGLDLYQDEIGTELWKTLFRQKKLQEQEICKVLLIDQKMISGIGNYLKSDILFQSKIRPDRLIKDLSDEELEIIRINSIQLVEKVCHLGGASIRTYHDLFGFKGSYQPLVYNKKFDSQGNKVTHSKFSDKRTTWWVPTIQH